MATYWELYVLSDWNYTISPRHPTLRDMFPHPQIGSIEDVTGQPYDAIPPIPNLNVWHVTCRAVVASAINEDVRFAILAGRQVWDNWYHMENGTYVGVDEGDPAPEGGTPCSIDDVPWRLTKSMRVAIKNWLVSKGLTLSEAWALVKDDITGNLDTKEIVVLVREWLKERPHG